MSDTDFWCECPEVQVDDQKLHGEPTVGKHRVAACTVIESDELGETPEEIADNYSLPLDKVRAVLSYYHARQTEPARSPKKFRQDFS